jgi:hypothetical protein
LVVMSLDENEIDAKTLYEELCCARGDMENRIEEQQLGLFAGRLQANQVRQAFPLQKLVATIFTRLRAAPSG